MYFKKAYKEGSKASKKFDKILTRKHFQTQDIDKEYPGLRQQAQDWKHLQTAIYYCALSKLENKQRVEHKKRTREPSMRAVLREEKRIMKALSSMNKTPKESFLDVFIRNGASSMVDAWLDVNKREREPYGAKAETDYIDEAIRLKNNGLLRHFIMQNERIQNRSAVYPVTDKHVFSAIESGNVDGLSILIDNFKSTSRPIDLNLCLLNAMGTSINPSEDVRSKTSEMIECLIKKGATNVSEALAGVKDVDSARVLIENGADVNFVSKNGKNILQTLQFVCEGIEDHSIPFVKEMRIYDAGQILENSLRTFDYLVEKGAKLTPDQIEWRQSQQRSAPIESSTKMAAISNIAKDPSVCLEYAQKSKDTTLLNNYLTAVDSYSEKNPDKDVSKIKQDLEKYIQVQKQETTANKEIGK